VAFETLIGWRYLYRRRHSRAVAYAFGLAFVTSAVFAALFAYATRSGTASGQASPALVAAVILLTLAAIVSALLVFFSVFTTVAIAGVMIGVSALVVFFAVTSGFQEEFMEKVWNFNAHIIIQKWGDDDFPEHAELERKLAAMPEVVGVAPFVFSEMQAARGATQASVLLKGIDPDKSPHVLGIGSQMIEGSIDALRGRPGRAEGTGARPEAGVIVGRELARKLRAHVGDTVKLMSPLAALDPSLFRKPGGAGAEPRSGDYTVVGICDHGFDEYDRRAVYMRVDEAQRLVGRFSGVELKLGDPQQAVAFARRLEKSFSGAPYRIIDWEELNHNLFTALRLQKFIIAIFLTIIVVVAAFNIIASLTMIVLSKRKEIAILKSMGASSAGVARVFQVAGLTIGALGVCSGIGFGLLMCGVARRYGYPLDPKIYLISRLPVHVRLVEVALTAVITLAICFLATVYPAVKASDLRPVEGLRYD
jgi:lipoprotein-releasing system permease protein